jgi:U11/U12 small nuclear ribonucleoprotein SNRNP31
MKDKDTRKSKGVAFILFLDKDSALNCTRAINNKQVSHSFSSGFLT